MNSPRSWKTVLFFGEWQFAPPSKNPQNREQRSTEEPWKVVVLLGFYKTGAPFWKAGLSFTSVPFLSLLPQPWEWSVIFITALMLYELPQHSKNTWLGPVSVLPAHRLNIGRATGGFTVSSMDFFKDENRTLGYFRLQGNFRPSYAAGETPLSFSTLIQNYISKSPE